MTGDSWSASFVHGGTTGRVRMAGAPGTEVIAATGPRYEYGGSQDHLVVRRMRDPGTEEIFAAVHETFDDTERVSAVEALAFEGDPGTAVGLRVTLMDGAVDYLVQTLDQGPDYPTHQVSGVALEVAGRFAHVRVRDGAAEWIYLADGASIRFADETLEAPGGDYSQRGAVTQVERTETGAAENAFVVEPPLTGEPSRWAGKTLLVTAGNGWTWAYRIERVEGARVVTANEPGFELDEGGMDRQYFPLQEHLGLERIEGPVTFLAAGSALRDAEGATWTTADPPVDPPPGDGGVSGGPDGSVGPDGAANPTDDPMATGGCGCTTPGAGTSPRGLGALGLLLGLAFVRRRRRTHSAASAATSALASARS